MTRPVVGCDTRSYDVLRAIERHALGADLDDTLRSSVVARTPDQGISVQSSRRLLFIGTALGWVVLTVVLALGFV